jgi:hypothetical protein
MIELRNPIPVKTELGYGMVIYVVNSGTYANDVWTVALNNGTVRHFRTDQITIESNATWGIKIP